MNEQNELNYWKRFISGDSDALSNLYLLYVDDLFSYGIKIYPDESLVKDAIQDVFIQLIEKQKKLHFSENLKAYLLKSIRNKILEELRTKNRKSEIEAFIFKFEIPVDYSIEKTLISTDENQARLKKLELALKNLSKHQREAIFLKYTSNCDYQQIAEILNISVSSARTLIYRSLKQMKQFILKELGDSFLLFYFTAIKDFA